MWQAYAERADVLPLNPGSDKASNAFNKKQKRFELKLGDDLPTDKAPFVQNRGFDVTASVTVLGDGVIVAQGGVTHGWALYVQQGEIRFATAIDGHRTVVPTGMKPVGKVEIEVSYPKNGKLKVSVDGKQVAAAELEGPMIAQPLDGLQVGSDTNGSVGAYRAPFELDGKVEKLVIEIQK